MEKDNQEITPWEDLGFGTSISGKGGRLINPDGTYHVLRIGQHLEAEHLYQFLVRTSWPRFFFFIFLFYVVMNMVFGVILLAIGVEYIGGEVGSSFGQQFQDCFFFSVQTSTTLGYGRLNPMGYPANIVAALNAFAGLLCFSLMTGLFFARFSRPDVQIVFSKNALISPHNDGKALVFRIANARDNNLTDIQVQLVMSWVEESAGVHERRFKSLSLERNFIHMFPLNWTLVHPITPKSLLYGKSPNWLKENAIELLVIVSGYDQSFGQQMRINRSYLGAEIIHNAQFNMMYHNNHHGQTVLDLDKINEYSLV